jgi:hypothetical protein
MGDKFQGKSELWMYGPGLRRSIGARVSGVRSRGRDFRASHADCGDLFRITGSKRLESAARAQLH